jgi:hypothetical protein
MHSQIYTLYVITPNMRMRMAVKQQSLAEGEALVVGVSERLADYEFGVVDNVDAGWESDVCGAGSYGLRCHLHA